MESNERAPRPGERIEVTLDVMDWTEEAGRRAGYAAKGPLVEAEVLPASQPGANAEYLRCRIAGVPDPSGESGGEVAEKLAYGDVVAVRCRGWSYADEVLFGKTSAGDKAYPLSFDLSGEAVLTGEEEISREDYEREVRRYADAYFYEYPVTRSGYGTGMLVMPAEYDFLAAGVFEEALRGWLFSRADTRASTPAPEEPLRWIQPETLAAVLEGHLYARHLLFAVPAGVSQEELAAFAEENLLECGISGTVGFFFEHPVEGDAQEGESGKA